MLASAETALNTITIVFYRKVGATGSCDTDLATDD